MRKSTILAWVALFSAIAGALAAAYFYIQRREQELDEYENLLFSEDFCNEAQDDGQDKDTDTDFSAADLSDEVE